VGFKDGERPAQISVWLSVTHHTGTTNVTVQGCGRACERVGISLLESVTVFKTCDTRTKNISSLSFLHSIFSTAINYQPLNRVHNYNNMEWSKKQYNQQYENWMPWVEDVRRFSCI
jgi:hypothetical protein